MGPWNYIQHSMLELWRMSTWEEDRIVIPASQEIQLGIFEISPKQKFQPGLLNKWSRKLDREVPRKSQNESLLETPCFISLSEMTRSGVSKLQPASCFLKTYWNTCIHAFMGCLLRFLCPKGRDKLLPDFTGKFADPFSGAFSLYLEWPQNQHLLTDLASALRLSLCDSV